MLKHAGERPQQHKQGFVQPVVCSLSLAALLPAVKTAFLGGKGERFDLAAVLYACTLLQKRSSCRDSFRTLLVENNLFGSEAKSWRCNAPAAHYIPALRGEQLLHMIACQCALARLVTLEVDWPLWRDSYSSVSPTYVERDRLNGNTNILIPFICQFSNIIILGLFSANICKYLTSLYLRCSQVSSQLKCVSSW